MFFRLLDPWAIELLVNAGLAKLFDPRAKFVTAWPLEGWIQSYLHSLFKKI